jgi:hypothetical protein
MATVDSQAVLTEHHEAESEHGTWMEEIRRWRGDHRRVTAMLAQVQSALLEDDAAREAHAESVHAHQWRMRRHEQAVAEHHRDRYRLEDDPLAESHHEFQAKHERAREAHQRIKERHETVMAEIERLFDKLKAPM